MKKTALITSLFLLLCAWATASAERVPAAPDRPGKSDKCPVCGMFVYKYPDWVAAIRLPGGEVLYFDGAKDMFRHLREKGTKAEAWVTEYYGLTMIDATRAFYVLGSDVYGPMGRELIPFATRAEAEEFMADHKGRRILAFPEVDAEILKGLK